MIRAVLDTNVLASGVTHPRGNSGRLVTAWRRRAFNVVISEHILEELAETLEDRYLGSREQLDENHRGTSVRPLAHRPSRRHAAVVVPVQPGRLRACALA